jgi:ERCC4-type nuclease
MKRTLENGEEPPAKVMAGETMLLIDNRERIGTDNRAMLLVSAMKQRHKFTSGQLGIAQLPLGDAAIKQGEVVRAVWERKTYADFVGSLNDTRLAEQKARLIKSRAEHPETMFGLVIEGTLNTTHLGAHNETHIRNLIWDWSKYGLTVVYTASVEETCDYLAHMRWSYAEEPSLEAAQEAAMMSMRAYAGKKKAVTPENYFLESLKMIPNVTGRIAKAITAKWPTHSALSKAFEGKPNLLHGLKVDEKGSLGKALSAKICKYVRPTGSQ